jgi:hypothetical protein
VVRTKFRRIRPCPGRSWRGRGDWDAKGTKDEAQRALMLVGGCGLEIALGEWADDYAGHEEDHEKTVLLESRTTDEGIYVC